MPEMFVLLIGGIALLLIGGVALYGFLNQRRQQRTMTREDLETLAQSQSQTQRTPGLRDSASPAPTVEEGGAVPEEEDEPLELDDALHRQDTEEGVPTAPYSPAPQQQDKSIDDVHEVPAVDDDALDTQEWLDRGATEELPSTSALEGLLQEDDTGSKRLKKQDVLQALEERAEQEREQATADERPAASEETLDNAPGSGQTGAAPDEDEEAEDTVPFGDFRAQQNRPDDGDARSTQQAGTEAAVATKTHFSAYYPRQAAAKTTYGLYVYAHLPDALDVVQRDVRDFVDELGGDVPRPVAADETLQLAEDTLLTIMPEAEGLEFEPVAVVKRWRAPLTRFDFTFTPSLGQAGDLLTGRIAVLVAGIEVASIPFTTEIIPAEPVLRSDAQPENPLAAAKFTHSPPVSLYERIFISYAREDKAIANAYRLAQMAIGHEVFMDSYSIRSGEHWQAALARAIDSADIFQLFWSQASSSSDAVRHEWQYALQYKCSETRCVGFIRPVYWETPMPPPPQELSHLNFRYVPFGSANAG